MEIKQITVVAPNDHREITWPLLQPPPGKLLSDQFLHSEIENEARRSFITGKWNILQTGPVSVLLFTYEKMYLILGICG